MTTAVLALVSAAMYGLADFVGGLLSRRTSLWAVAVVSQLAAAVVLGIAAPFLGGQPSGTDWAWGALAGVGIGSGTAFLYRGLATGRMSVVAPLSAVGAAILPVIVGVVTGERPPILTWVGIACAFPAIWLVSSGADAVDAGGRTSRLGAGVADALLAGLGFGLMFSALGQVSDGAGIGPLALAEVVSIGAVIALATAFGQPWLPRDAGAWSGASIGALSAVAAVLFLFATQSGLLTVAAVLTSLYPAFTILLASIFLREVIHGPQAAGLGLTAVAVTLVAIG